MISVSDDAVREAKRLLELQGKPEWGVRVGVKGGGCSGLSYTMNFEQEPTDKDKIFDYEGLRVFVDMKSYLYLNQLTLDYSADLMGGGFKFVNPAATHTCSCGQSFNA